MKQSELQENNFIKIYFRYSNLLGTVEWPGFSGSELEWTRLTFLPDFPNILLEFLQ